MINIKVAFVLFFGFVMLLISCNSPITSKQDGKGIKSDVFTKVFSTDNLSSQTFTIDCGKDNLITGDLGTIIRINKNTFVDNNGNAVNGNIEIKLIEVLKPIDMVLGNLTTTFNGKPLETGGMIYIDANIEGKAVSIANNKQIQLKVPADSTLSGMSIFEGMQNAEGMKWVNPVKIPKAEDLDSLQFDTFEKTTNVTYSVDGFKNSDKFPEIVNAEVSRIAWEGDGLKISKDSVFKVDKYIVHFYKNDKVTTWSETFMNKKGENSFAEDRNTSYIFSIKKLGWANIDRLLDDPRTKEVELVTSIGNQNEFKFIYVTLITQNMYLPGYQKKDNTFCFSHNDDEKQHLPVGEKATILATAYVDGKPYFAIKKIIISENQTVSFNLMSTTMEKLKIEMAQKI